MCISMFCFGIIEFITLDKQVVVLTDIKKKTCERNLFLLAKALVFAYSMVQLYCQASRKFYVIDGHQKNLAEITC